MKAFLLRLAKELVKEGHRVLGMIYLGSFLGIGMLLGMAAAWSVLNRLS